MYTLRSVIVNETVTDDKCTDYEKVVKQLINNVRKFKRDVKNFIC